MKSIEKIAGRSVTFSASALLSLALLAGTAFAQSVYPKNPGIWLSSESGHALSDGRKEQLAQSLRRITGLNGLHFADDGSLVTGPTPADAGGSVIARQILSCALSSGYAFVIEDHSDSPSVNFGQLDEGLRYEDSITGLHLLIWRVRLDFNDFREMEAPREVRASFDAGFTTLHELLHGLGYRDAAAIDELGECEERLNRARAELNLPLRDQYFGDTLQVAQRFVSVRLRFRSNAPKASARSGRRRALYLFFMLPSEYEPRTTPIGAAALDCTRKR